ncbi:hypothetical protein pb186bvf_020753 [Paramecium bursaria]
MNFIYQSSPQSLLYYIYFSFPFVCEYDSFKLSLIIQILVRRSQNQKVKGSGFKSIFKSGYLYYLFIGDSCFKNQKYEQSIVLYDLVLTIDPQSSQAYINKGKVYVIRKHYDEANRMFDKAFQLNPSDYQVYFNRGNIHFAKKEYEKAKEKYAHAITLNNQDSELFEKYGDTLSALGNMEDSIKLYQQGIQISQNHQTYEKIRNLLISQGKNEEGFQIFKQLEDNLLDWDTKKNFLL